MKVILDTNILIAAAFARGSASARIVAAVRDGRLEMVWDEPTRSETRRLFRQIPRLSWDRIAGLYLPEHEHREPTRPEEFAMVEDSEDRKFAALAHATGAMLITNDKHLLAVRSRLNVDVLTPGEFVEWYM